jgi:hypothetical protein
MDEEKNQAPTPDEVSPTSATELTEVAEAKEVPEEPKIAPIAELDASLMRDVLGQIRDLHKTLTATLEQNIVDAQREHIANAANVLTSAAESISNALNVEVA